MESTSFDSDFGELLSVFIAGGVRFLVVGGYAVSSHGHPRNTKDLDLWVEPELSNARRAWEALAVFGMPLRGIRPEDLAEPGPWLQFGRVPKRVDVLTAIGGLEFAGAWERRVVRRFGKVDAPVLCVADLILNKRTVGRTQDIADAERLEAIHGDGDGAGRVSERRPARRKARIVKTPRRRA